MKKIRHALQLVRYMGVGWTASRLLYALKAQAGLMRQKTPVKTHQQCSLTALSDNPVFADDVAYAQYRRFEAPHLPVVVSAVDWDRFTTAEKDAIAEARAIQNGTFTLFSHMTLPLGYPPNWWQNPIDKASIYPKGHWSEIPDFAQGDIKLVWELGRFGFAYTLVRAWGRTGDEQYAESFWQLFEDWWRHNPPNEGVHWKCGQEISFRVMACCFAFFAFLSAKATTPERIKNLAVMLGESAHRIFANIDYALNQQNNHGISEAMGLWAVGVLFPEFRQAGQWVKTGMQHLCREADRLVYADGGFSQHSLNYHRVMLQDYLWVFAVSRRLSFPLDTALLQKIEKAWQFLYQLHDPLTGKVPNSGSNDGALILPLCNCDYQDYRPVLQAMSYYFRGKRCFNEGPWDEDLLWLFGESALSAPVEATSPASFAAAEGGYYTIRKASGWALIRCASFRHRPAHADQLHVDIWWKGFNMAMDPGTFSYNPSDREDANFSSTRFHNTIMVDGMDQMDKVSRFLWLPWSRAELLNVEESAHVVCWQGQHNGYARMRHPVSHRRAVICLGEEHWVVIDALQSDGMHDYTLHWLTGDFPHQWNPETGCLNLHPEGLAYTIMTGASVSAVHRLTRASSDQAYGWQSLYYHKKAPALSKVSEVRAKKVVFWTVFSPQAIDVVLEGQHLKAASSDWQADIHLGNGDGPIIRRVEMFGNISTSLEISSKQAV
ncbi:Heparin-sulfate lyase precursor [Legionella geestiana]|uniref:Heparin-sulfate lyase n=1 Tax=Legionella geestiana TaxID=45065 RepID=A0A0W0U9P4_9GAMM|nr:alginate lyase family protein [Legionella geestiana]KTD04511.1 Heparin-sulfate lyase precursor [Legionella geestiana]QBS12280.1 alginate lyase family protein [Legionella geestiana]STX52985.1 Uncharacterized protein conserved in bacteria [Legionella geestiana]